MPITAYLSKRSAEIRTPLTDGFDHPAGADVLSSDFSATDTFQREADRAKPWTNFRTSCSPDDYDPILKHHLKIRQK